MAIRVDHTSQTVSWFKDRLAERLLNFKPPFQRNPVWLPKHKAYLIDTALRGLPIPEVYIQKETTPAGRTTYSLVDGQQRVRTLLEFAQGKVELMEKYSPGRDGDTWEDLSDAERTKFWNYTLIVREVSGATDADLRDLFERLNQHTITLKPQELRNARFKGEFIQAVTDLADLEYWAENGIVSATEIRRMTDIEFMAELLVGIMHGPQNKKASLDSAFQTYEDEFRGKVKWLNRFESARSSIEEMLPRIGETRWRGKSDYYSLFLAIDVVAQESTPTKAQLKTMGAHLRRFGEEVSRRLSKEGTSGRFSKDVIAYASAVEKAASDKDRREARHRILVKMLLEHVVRKAKKK